jgi:hypothetical protein
MHLEESLMFLRLSMKYDLGSECSIDVPKISMASKVIECNRKFCYNSCMYHLFEGKNDVFFYIGFTRTISDY